MCDMGFGNWLHMYHGEAETQKLMVSGLGLGNWYFTNA